MPNYADLYKIKQLCDANSVPVPKKVSDGLLSKEYPRPIEPFTRNGLVSLKDVAEGLGISPVRTRFFLNSFGYVRHPALARSAGKIRIGRDIVRMYVKLGSEALWLETLEDVREAWLTT
jgi:hypothetical protein